MNCKEHLKSNWIKFLIILSITPLIILQPSFSAEYLIKIRELQPTIEIMQGSWNRSTFRIQNTYNESLIIYWNFEKPSGFGITYYPEKYSMLGLKSLVAAYLNISVDEEVENNSYTLKFWLESFTKVNDTRIQSEKRSINVTVLSNPSLINLTTTTTTTSTTTTIAVNITTTTIEETTTLPHEEKTRKISLKKEYLIIPVVLFILIVIPFLAFRK